MTNPLVVSGELPEAAPNAVPYATQAQVDQTPTVSYSDQIAAETAEPPEGADKLTDVLRLPYEVRADLFDAFDDIQKTLESFDIDESGELKTTDLSKAASVFRLAGRIEKLLTPVAKDPSSFHDVALDLGIHGVMALYSYVVQSMGKDSPSPAK